VKITDLIAQEINAMLEQDGGKVRIQRNELANRLGCVPSQINYTITNRFTVEQGYLVESRRGGGGFIQIIKIQSDHRQAIFHLINSIGDEIDEYSSRVILQNLVCDKILTEKEGKLILSALLDTNFKGLPNQTKQKIRALILKTMLLNSIG
jgi:transcriptional regulator CtsR